MMMVGFSGSTLPDQYYNWLKDGLGGIILFSRNIENPEQLAHLTDEIWYATRENPAFLGVDQEGGRVFRLKEPFTRFPTARLVGQVIQKTGSTELAFKMYAAMALELKAMGFSVDFAPVLDVDTHLENPIIGDRSFSSDPRKVAEAGLALIEAFRSQQIIPCGKHFPGHGGTRADSHLELPVIEDDIDHLRDIEMVPFHAAIYEDLEMIMTAHVLYSKIDPQWPATMSEKIILELLRRECQFNGVVISDDLEMKAIKDRYEWRMVVGAMLRASVDIFLVCHDLETQLKVFEAIVDCVETKEVKPEDIRASLQRIATLKKKKLINPRPFPQHEWKAIVGCEAHRNLVAELESYGG